MGLNCSRHYNLQQSLGLQDLDKPTAVITLLCLFPCCTMCYVAHGFEYKLGQVYLIVYTHHEAHSPNLHVCQATIMHCHGLPLLHILVVSKCDEEAKMLLVHGANVACSIVVKNRL